MPFMHIQHLVPCSFRTLIVNFCKSIYVVVAWSGANTPLVESHPTLRINKYTFPAGCKIHRGSYMSAHVFLKLLKSWGKEVKCEACRAIYLFFATSLINSIKQKHEC